MADKPEYGPIIADLEAKITEFQNALATVRALSGVSGEASSTTTPAAARSSGRDRDTGALRGDQFFGMKAPDAIRAYLGLVKQPRGAARITTDLMEHGFTTSSQFPANTLRTTLKRMEDSGEVVQIKKEWGLTSWYPGLRKTARKTTDGGDESPEENG